MAAVDVDNSGYIDYNEFVRVTIDNSKMESEKNLQASFDVFDKDQNGKISAAELKEVLSGNNASDDEIWQQLIQDFDENGDGEIDIDEFKRIILSHI